MTIVIDTYQECIAMKQPKNCLAMASAMICLDNGAWSMIFAVCRMLVLQNRADWIHISTHQTCWQTDGLFVAVWTPLYIEIQVFYNTSTDMFRYNKCSFQRMQIILNRICSRLVMLTNICLMLKSGIVRKFTESENMQNHKNVQHFLETGFSFMVGYDHP